MDLSLFCDYPVSNVTVRGLSSLKGRRTAERLLFVSSLPESGSVSRGATAFDIFWLGVSPVETETGERRVSGRGMEPSPVFLIAD